jgi:hypothetical protein
MRQNIMTWEHVEEALHLLADRKQKEGQKGALDKIQPPKTCPPWDLLLPARSAA